MRLFRMNLGQARVRLVQAGAALAAAALIAGCGSQYRPVVTPINPSGPPAQPSSLAVVVSAPSTTTPGIATIVDYSGDTVVATAPIGRGPSAFTVDASGSTGYTINSDGTLTNFPVSSSLQAKNVNYFTLPSTAEPVNLFSPSAGLLAADLCGISSASSVCQSVADVFSGSPLTSKLTIPLAPAVTPVAIVGIGASGQRSFAISQNIVSPTGVECNASPTAVSVNGEVDTLETNNTVSAHIPVGTCPVYGIESSDAKRLFVLNRGSDTVSVINVQNNTLDNCTPFTDPNTGRTVTCHPSLPLSTTAGLAQDANNDVPTVAGPVYAEYNSATNQLVVADYDGNRISIIDVSLDEYGNDSATFGTTYTVPLDTDKTKIKNPASVTVLYDGSRAYTANQADGTVSIVNMASGSHTLEKTLTVVGHPRTVASTQNSSYGKVYVASPDSPYVTIIRTDQDIVDTTILVQGNVVDVRVNYQNAVSGNSNTTSRVPGYGQPCNLPNAVTTLAACQLLPLSQ